ncbi:conserved oligomeric Golgi complex subunit 5 isoform X2 [Fopius arisanus]|uniref:Conserved oligomeric Golgi complex subunit 5 n=1 Tax=Fopius arisanus TaxID=64838 RepID=A0A9R1TFQ7_9HYME|nr:PREDICTED: conserved oligomeric Golgi complex subunit 5 isoform X2 [Fopius arisanus]
MTVKFFRQFLAPESKQNDATKLLTVAQQLKKLTEALEVLDTEIHKQVLTNHEDLLSQVTWVEKIEGVLSIMHTHVQSLLSAVERLRSKIVEPFNRIEAQTLILTRLHETTDLLRRVGRVQHLLHSQKLYSQISNATQSSDMIKAAKSLHELEQLMSDTDLGGLDIVADDQQAVKTLKASVQRVATHSLTQGLQQSDSRQVGTAIQVFENLVMLRKAVEKTEETALGDIERVAREALDISVLSSQDIKRGAPGRAAIPSPGTTTNVRTRLWENLDRLFQETVYTQCVQIELLERILLEHHTSEFSGFSSSFWDKVTALLSKILIERSQGSTFIKQALEGEYPKFLRVFLDLKKRLKERPQAMGTYTISRDILQPFENAYLSRSISRLLDPVHTMFSADSSPSQDEIDSLIRTVTSELSVSLVDESLSTVVAKNVGKAVRLFCLKCEQGLITGGEASQVIDAMTPGQQTNVNLANLLYYLASQISRVVANLAASLPGEGASVIAAALEETNTLTKNILAPLMGSITDAIESIILTMHDDPDFRETSSPLGREISCSLYMRELQGFILRSVTTFLSSYKNQVTVAESCNTVASRCIELFVRHACLIRPLTDYGRAKLIVDFSQMEAALGPLCRGGHLGFLEQQQYRTLRALKALLALGPEKMVERVVEMRGEGGVPASLVLLHLFSGAPPELQSPHQSAGWSINRLSQWIDGHPREEDRVALSSGPLQKYEATIRQRGMKNFHPLFPLMMKLTSLGGK